MPRILRRSGFHTLALLAACVWLSACSTISDLKADVKNVQAVQAALASRFGGTPTVSLKNGTALTVDYVNLPNAPTQGDARNAVLLEVAQVAYAAYPKRDSLASLSVAVSSVAGAGGLTVKRSDAPLFFSGTELRALGSSSSASYDN